MLNISVYSVWHIHERLARSSTSLTHTRPSIDSLGPPRKISLVHVTRGRAVRQLVGLITQRSQVRILPPLPTLIADKSRSAAKGAERRLSCLLHVRQLRRIVPGHFVALFRSRRQSPSPVAVARPGEPSLGVVGLVLGANLREALFASSVAIRRHLAFCTSTSPSTGHPVRRAGAPAVPWGGTDRSLLASETPATVISR